MRPKEVRQIIIKSNSDYFYKRLEQIKKQSKKER